MPADEGCNVSVRGRHADEVTACGQGLEGKGVQADGDAIDVADKTALESRVAHSAGKLCGIDIVVANVSALAVSDNEEGRQNPCNVDLMHRVRVVKAVMAHLEGSKPPSITIVSIDGALTKGVRLRAHSGRKSARFARPYQIVLV